MRLEKYSFGVGDRFGMEGQAQLGAVIMSGDYGVDIVPVWNKSNREHQIIGTNPEDVRLEADEAVEALGYKGPYYVDADHINKDTVGAYIEHSDFFTLDVAGYIGKPAGKNEMEIAYGFLEKYTGSLNIPGIAEPYIVTGQYIYEVLNQYLTAIIEAGNLYSLICKEKGEENFIAEVSMDEVNKPQSPLDLFLILALISREGIRIQTIAPKFTGRFNKGVDYVGNIDGFQKEFEEDLLVINYAIELFDLPSNLKLSIHSGSDKFSIYPVIGDMIRKHDAGIHVKTAGTTWLEEVIGLSMGEAPSVLFVKEIYLEALHRLDELCGPYSDVININNKKLPGASVIEEWTGYQLAESIRHIPGNPSYNPDMRQLMHVAYKLAAERRSEFISAIQRNRDVISKQVEENIFERHIKRLFNF